MTLRLQLALSLAALKTATAAITITIQPDGSGGTTFNFTQTSDNPSIATSNLLGNSFAMMLPSTMFSSSILGTTGGSSSISGIFPEPLANFTDLNSGMSYDLQTLLIAGNLSTASLGFERGLPSNTPNAVVQMNLDSPSQIDTTISPLALVQGIHTTNSPLFGSVTVNVIPEPVSGTLLSIASLGLILRRRRSSEVR